MRKIIPLAKPWVDQKEYRVLKEVIDSGWLSQGKKVMQFEKAVAEYLGARYAIATSSCTTALHLCLIIAGIKKGDEVLCPSFSFIASANAIEYVQAKPVFVDIDERTFNLCAADLEKKVTPRTKAIMVVHQLGLAAEMDKIRALAKKRRLIIIEDAACALGARYKGKKIGQNSRYCSFSFHPRKITATGEGGMIVTDSPAVAGQAQSLRSHGASLSAWAKHQSLGVSHERFCALGYNYRLSDIHAAIGIVQLQKLERMIRERQKMAAYYNRLLKNVAAAQVPCVPKGALHTFQSYLVRIRPPVDIVKLVGFMARRGISCRRGIQPIHLEPYYLNKYGRVNLAVTEELSRSSMFLPIYHGLRQNEQKYVVETLKLGLRALAKS